MDYRRDPIETSSPPRFGGRSDSGDEQPVTAPFVTQPTQPLEYRSLFFAAPGDSYITQPTQIITPRTQRSYNPQSSQIQVPRSSPAAEHRSPSSTSQSQSQNRIVSAMAPPGTYSFIPKAVPRPRTIDLTSDDPPVDQDSEEEEFKGSNIAMSKLEQARVQETPPQQKSASFGFDLSRQFAYDATRKRPADVTSSFPPTKKPKQTTPQTRPSRAMPVDLTMSDDEDRELTLGDIPELAMRNKVTRLGAIYPNISVKGRLDALILKKGHYDDACGYLADVVEREEAQQSLRKGTAVLRSATPEPVLTKATAKRVLKAPVQSLQDRYAKSSQYVASTAESPEKPKRKGKLMRGRRNRSPTPILVSSSPIRAPQQQPVPDDDDDGIVAISDDDSDVQEVSEEEYDDGTLFDFFNNCSVEAMVDLSGHKEEEVRVIFEQRPFRSMDAIEKIHIDLRKTDNGKKARKPKITFGERLVDAAKAMWNAYTTIDKVVQRCEERGRPMVNGMQRWGIDIFGASTDGEIAATNFDDSDSGYQTARTPSTNESDSDREDLQKVADRAGGKRKLLKKPAIMNDDIELKDYQVVGLNWLNLLWQNGISGILADDMGLGKTCQVIAFLSHLKEIGAPGPHLIIVPGSTLENWAREFKHFSQEINFQIYYGGQNERFGMHDQIAGQIEDGNIDVILTTYDLAYKKQDNAFLRKCKPQMCIFDEGHLLRNSTTKRYKDLMKIRAKCRLLLTGTPLQNSLQELASILAFLMPDIFENEEVHDSVQTVFKHKAKVNESDTHGTLLSTQRINRARSMMTPFVLRRKKAQVLKHLPTKTCRVEYCELTPVQKKLYNEQLERQRKILLDRAAGLTPKETANVMMRLRQSAIHPLLFRERYTDDTIRKMSKVLPKEEIFNQSVPAYIFEELELYQDFQCHQLCLKYPRTVGKFALKDAEWMDSGKVAKLVELLRRFKANGDRTLVFSQFTSVMDILEWVLDDLGMSYCRLDGSTPVAERQQLLDEFHNDASIPVFMLSTKSGGAGINLACANKVVIFDSSFNPQDDIQAENRAHRVGQTREVEVVRLVTRGTVEEQIHALGVSKLELDKMVAGEEGAGVGAGRKDELDEGEKKGMEAVQAMLKAQLEEEGVEGEAEGSDGTVEDVKDTFLQGLKKAGLDMSAA